MKRLIPCFVLSAVTGCTEMIRFDYDPLQDLVEIEVSPAEATITLTELSPPFHTLQLSATGRLRDGSVRDVTSFVQWSIDNWRLGSTDAHGVFTASHTAAGQFAVMLQPAPTRWLPYVVERVGAVRTKLG